MGQTRDNSDDIKSLQEYFARIWGPSTSNHVPFAGKSPNKLPLRGHVLDKKVFREPPNLYLPLACTVYLGLFIFPRRLHSTSSRDCWRLLFRRPTATANRYVFRVTRLVHGIASWHGFAKEHSPNFDNHSKFLRSTSRSILKA